MANHVDLLPTMRSDYRYDLLAKHEEADLLAARERAMANGIEVDESVWEKLQSLAKATLVESFDASHLGAGPAD